MKNITILGATGSIGGSTLDVISRYPDRFRVFALTAHRQIQRLEELCRQWQPRYAVVSNEEDAIQLRQNLSDIPTEILSGKDALCDVASDAEVDMVMAAIVGAAGLLPTLSAAKSGKTILLANKETLVMAGTPFMKTVRENGACVLPVDSEHNAIFQSLPETVRQVMAKGDFYDSGSLKYGIQSLILTASGGPFLNTPLETFPQITPQMAIKHPNWQMGRKISVDSATMMNKGLEVIEACHLFNVDANMIEVIIHPQSVIHSMVRYADGSVLAQLGTPDMRTPIAFCLGVPERLNSGVTPLDFFSLNHLSFVQPDLKRFPCLQLAFDAIQMGGNATCVLNAANEIAVAAFLENHIRFDQIAQVVSETLSKNSSQADSDTIESLIDVDQTSRQYAQRLIKSFQAA